MQNSRSPNSHPHWRPFLKYEMFWNLTGEIDKFLQILKPNRRKQSWQPGVNTLCARLSSPPASCTDYKWMVSGRPQLEPHLRHSRHSSPAVASKKNATRDPSGKVWLLDTRCCLFLPRRGTLRELDRKRKRAPRLTPGVTCACDVNWQTDFVISRPRKKKKNFVPSSLCQGRKMAAPDIVLG